MSNIREQELNILKNKLKEAEFKVLGINLEIENIKYENAIKEVVPEVVKDDWKDLNIKNIPTDFCYSDDYKVEYKNKNNKWKSNGLKPSERGLLICNLARGINVYRYKLKPKTTIDCDLDKLAISIKGAIDTGKIRITDEKSTVIERLETIVKEFNCSVSLEANGDIAIYRKKPQPPQPIIIKSGDTWVAEYLGVDYLCINPEKYKHTDFSIAMEISLIKDHVYWKPISEIEITDELSKLRPMVIIKNELEKLYGMHRAGIYITNQKIQMTEKLNVKLATVKDLQE